ncbi:recombination mediator RecR [Campylobacter sp. US33a]|uniref:Recombination protein RecR n=1 Tax=Campylobacter sp. CCS1377 TaxID=3158229 RepID=A0AAU7EA66_9BACT|nr:recombination mediator RecR [Campylobacter sp. US33a]MCW1360768.1 recombination mediator RecR [Campylobacter jejuni]TEY00543.1 recombination protein RecR [Campylobacter sp. US33a]
MIKGLEKFDELVKSFASLPTIGKKTAVRLAYFICMNDHLLGMKLAHNIENALRFIKPCIKCGGLSENELCEICSNESRDRNFICIVESPKDILILEESDSYKGLYFVLEDLSEEKIEKLREMILEFQSQELIFALTHSINSDALIFFVEDKLRDLNLKFSKIAQGIPSGVHLENVDFISLHRAINFRTYID